MTMPELIMLVLQNFPGSCSSRLVGCMLGWCINVTELSNQRNNFVPRRTVRTNKWKLCPLGAGVPLLVHAMLTFSSYMTKFQRSVLRCPPNVLIWNGRGLYVCGLLEYYAHCYVVKPTEHCKSCISLIGEDTRKRKFSLASDSVNTAAISSHEHQALHRLPITLSSRGLGVFNKGNIFKSN